MSVWKALVAIGAAMLWLAMAVAYGGAMAATTTDGKPSLPSSLALPPSLLPSKEISSSRLGLGIGVPIRFTITYDTTREQYEAFLGQVMETLGPGDNVHGVPRLRQPTLATSNPNRYFLIEVVSYTENIVTFVIDVTNVYVVGFQVGGYTYVFSDFSDFPATTIFPGTRVTTLSYTGSYTRLDPNGTRRLALPLGITEFSEAVDYLYRRGGTGHVRNQEDLIPSLLVAIQMISESVRNSRFAHLSGSSIQEIGDGMVFHGPGTAPGLSLISLAASWQDLAQAVQRSPNNEAVELQQDDYSKTFVSSVLDILALGITLLIYDTGCTRNNNKNHNDAIIRMLGDDAVQKGSISSGVEDSGSSCPDTVSMLIRGYNRMCLEVKDGKYVNSNYVVMNTCANKVSQNWTFNSDGSITSNGMCLTALQNGPPDVGIYTCDASYASGWQLLDDGSIYNNMVKKVLTVYNPGSMYYLSLTPQTDYLIAQGWKTGLLSTPPYWNVSIVGMDNLCLQTDGSVLWLAACIPTVTGQQWLIFPDGSVLPNIDFPNKCLTSSLQKGKPISVTLCSETKQGLRWNFAIDGTIQDLAGGFVMDVYNNDITQHIITWPANGGANQKWVKKLAS